MRALDIVDVVAGGITDLAGLSLHLGLTRSTTHRLASTLVARGYLRFQPGQGYGLGSKLLELGWHALHQNPLTRLARRHLEQLAAATEDTVHLGVLDGWWALYLDKIPGMRRVEISSQVGERHPVWSTGLGKALLLDGNEATWRSFFARGEAHGDGQTQDLAEWLDRMRAYALLGYAFDLEENEPEIRCVAAPVRDASGRIVAAISLSSLNRYMTDERMDELTPLVVDTAKNVSHDLGWHPAQSSMPR
ncbi:IclR family transcriptional regulator [Arboricoccus pini]|nr:IclR family transcriptional regulator [Arboricoccus pini]